LLIYIWQRNETEDLYGFPAMDGPSGGVKVSFFLHPVRDLVTPAAVDRSRCPDDKDCLRAALRKFLPSLKGARVQSKVCL
jgi:sarcosine oxidase